MTHQYSNTAVQTTLAAGVNAAATSIQVSATTGFPVAPYVLALDADGASQELVLVTSVAGTTLTVTRGYDNTTAVDHSVGAVVRHSHAAKDFKDSRDHEAATVAHGATGAVVGTTNVQALTNKDLSSGTNTFPASLATDAEVAVVSGNLTAHEADTSTHGVGEIVGRTEAQTLTNKTVALGSNTVSGTTAQFNAANTDGDFATLAGTETLTNKTLTSGTNVFPTDIVRSASSATLTSDTAGIGAETLIVQGSYNAVAGATYKVTAYCQVLSDTAGAFTTLLLKEDSIGVGVVGTQLQECIKDHRIANRREGVAVSTTFIPAIGGARYVKLTAVGGSGLSTVKGSATAPVTLVVERIA